MAEVKALLQYRASPGFVDRLHAEAPPWLEVVVVDETHREVFEAELPSVEVIALPRLGPGEEHPAFEQIARSCGLL